MLFESFQGRVRLDTYTFYPERAEFVSTHRRFSNWACVVAESGRFRFDVEAEAGEAGRGDLVFAAPDGKFERSVIQAPLRYHVLQWTFVGAHEEAVEQRDLWRAGRWPVSDGARLSATLGLLRPLLGRSDVWGARRREHLLEELLHLAWQEHSEPQTSDVLMREAAALLRERASQPLSMSEVARAVGLSPVAFTRRFRAAMGRNPIEFLTQIRLENAQRLLIETGAPLDAVAARCGWASGAYLSHVFERHFGTTPGRFRASHRV